MNLRRVVLRSLPASAAAVVLLASSSAFAQAIDTTLWVTNGDVYAVVRAGGTIYVGGTFTQVGPATGAAVPVDAATGLPLGVPRVAGAVRVVAPDGSGGWYVGGEFTHVGGIPRSNLAHILSDHTLSPWNPNANTGVNAIAVSGGTVYVGGFFTTVGGQARSHIAALDAVTGLATAWNPNANIGGTLYGLAVSGGTVYAGGFFATIGGQARSRIAALDAASGLATAWNPNANNGVLALAVSGGTLYAGGDFTTIGGQARNNIAALDEASGLATAWDPSASGRVQALAVSAGTVYAGGLFTTIGGQTRNNIVALDAVSGLATAWNPNANSLVAALAVSGGTVYAGGLFTTIGGQARNHIAALNGVTGLATAWNPNVSGYVGTLAESGGTVYVGGEFATIGGQTRNNIAAMDEASGLVTAWNPNANFTVRALAVDGETVYAGGFFTTVGGQTRNSIAALDRASGLATAWNPNANAFSTVTALALSGGTVYAGGNFTTIGGQARNRIAALDRASGLATAWNPNANNTVWALVVSGGSAYAGGQFTSIGGQTRNNIVALDALSGLATAWNPNASGIVYALAVNGGTLYAGGEFTAIGGQTRNRIAALDRGSGLATAWNPNASSFGVYALAVSDGTVYAGGNFTSIGGQPRNHIAALDRTSGLATAWNPGRGSVFTLSVSDGTVYAGGYFNAMGGRPQSHVAAIAAALVLQAVQPAIGGDAGKVTTTIFGENLQGGTTVTLSRTAQPDIPGTDVAVATDGKSLTTTFDLQGAATGLWDVVVTNPDLQTATLPGAFTIETGAPYEIRVNLLAPAQMRPDRRKAFDIVLENLGNTDVLDVPLWISRIPADATIELGFPLTSPPQAGGEPDWSTVPLTLDGPGGKYLALVIPRLPPGYSVRRVYLTVPNSVTNFTLGAALAPPWADGELFRACLAGGGAITAPACMGAQLTAINTYLSTTPVEALSGIGLWAKIAWQCEGAATLPAALAKAEQILDFMLQPVEDTAVTADCEVTLVPRWRDRRLVTIVTSVDPNDKLGAGGVGPNRLIGIEQLLPYSIRFENLETATAPAQEVLVLDALDQNTLDIATVSLGPITFGDRTVYPPPGLPSYTTDVDLRPAQDLMVRVGVGLDQATGVLSWSLTSLDPVTGAVPEDPQSGFLPPNVTPPQGEGSVLFTVMTKPGLTGGTAVLNQATLNFDGASLMTPLWSNTLDTTPPQSQVVVPSTGTTDSASFTVRWETEGSPSDLHDFSVYVSENGSPYRPWRVHTTVTADTITAPGGRTYAFYSLARDVSGNLEPVPETPDVQTFSRVAVEDGVVRQRFALEGAAPNPATGETRVWFTLPSHKPAVLEVVDVAGRRVLRREVGSLGPGRHAVDVSAATRKPGLYFLRLAQAGQVHHARMVVVQ